MTIQDLISWHRSLGIIATLFIIMLVVSGLVLNHAGTLKLDRIFIENEMLLDWYGIAPAKAPVSFPLGRHRVTQIDEHLYLDDREIEGSAEELRGGVTLAHILVLAFPGRLYLLTEQGNLIEKISRAQGLPRDISNVGLGGNGELLVRTPGGVLCTDEDMVAWEPCRDTGGNWSVSEKLPGALEKELMRSYRGKGLSLEKVLVDLHSGRIFGQAGVYLVDISAIIFIIMALSGWWLWLKRRALQKEINGRL